jgi:hypothetical protein
VLFPAYKSYYSHDIFAINCIAVRKYCTFIIILWIVNCLKYILFIIDFSAFWLIFIGFIYSCLFSIIFIIGFWLRFIVIFGWRVGRCLVFLFGLIVWLWLIILICLSMLLTLIFIEYWVYLTVTCFNLILIVIYSSSALISTANSTYSFHYYSSTLSPTPST